MDSEQVGQRIRQLREERRLTRQEVADRCAELGHPEITASALVNIEAKARADRRGVGGKRRRDVRVDELPVLAVVLDVPVASLLVPVGGAGPVEVLPGVHEDAWTAYRWLIGEFPTSDLGKDHDPRVNYFRSDEAGRAIATYRGHHAALHSYLQLIAQNPTAANSQAAVLAATRVKMHEAGWWLPPVPDDVAVALVEPLAGWGYVADEDGSLRPLPPSPYDGQRGGAR